MPKDKNSVAAAAASAAATTTTTAAATTAATSSGASSGASGFNYAPSFSVPSAPAPYEPILTEVELVSQHALVETMAESISAYNATPPAIRKRKAHDEDEDELDAFLDSFSPTQAKILEAIKKKQEMNAPKNKKDDFSTFKFEVMSAGGTPCGIELYSILDRNGSKVPYMIVYGEAYHTKEVLKGPKGFIKYLNPSLHTLIHDNFVAADYLTGIEKQKIFLAADSDAFQHTMFVSQFTGL